MLQLRPLLVRFSVSLLAALRDGRRRRRCLLIGLLLGSGAVFAAEDLRQPVNINQANAESLAANLKGVGLRRAQAIVAYREEHGPFKDAYELTAIKGLGEKMVAENEANIRLAE